MEHWRVLSDSNRDYIIVGDNNLCAKSWQNDNHDPQRKLLAEQVLDFMIEESAVQLVEEYTRSEMVNNVIQRSCIDHVITNIPNKCNMPEVLGVGNSDHLAVKVQKYTSELRQHPNAIKKRSFKNFNKDAFLADIDAEDFMPVIEANDIETAAQIFENKFTRIYDKHAPIRVIQQHRNYVPYLSDATKELMNERDELKKSATKEDDLERKNALYNEYKIKRNLVQKCQRNDKKEYYKEKFDNQINNDSSTKEIWKTVRETLKMTKNLAPKQIKVAGSIVNSPQEMANAFSKIFLDKALKIRELTSGEPIINPTDRLQEFVDKRENELPEFDLKEIDLETLRNIVNKKLKNSKVNGYDYIDAYSLKLAFPRIELVLLHLVNLSIRTCGFASN